MQKQYYQNQSILIKGWLTQFGNNNITTTNFVEKVSNQRLNVLFLTLVV